MTELSENFCRVDRTPDPARYVDYLDLVNSHATTLRYKQVSFEMMRIAPGMVVLDAACGVGFDAIMLAKQVGDTGRVHAIDKSAVMARQTKSRAEAAAAERAQPGAFLAPIFPAVADVLRMPFRDAHFDGIRIDRALQHIPDGRGAIQEMVRVLRPGGSLVAAEPNWATFHISSPSSPVSQALAKLRRDRVPAGKQIPLLPDYFSDAGLGEVATAVDSVMLKSFAEADAFFSLTELVRSAAAEGIISGNEGAEWALAAQLLSVRGEFSLQIDRLLVSGIKPRV